MRNVRQHPDPLGPQSGGPAGTTGGPGRGRFNVLLTEERWHGPDHWSFLLPRLMEPLGVVSYKVRCGEEAWDVAQHVPIHAAVVDLATPRIAPSPRHLNSGAPDDSAAAHESGDRDDSESSNPSPPGVPGGLWLLELFRRMPNRPPVVIVRSRTITTQDVNRLLRDALQLGAFTVIEDPRLEQLLTVFQRLLDRLYRGQWPE